MKTLSEEYEKFIIPTYARFDVDVERGQGCRVWSFDGREYLDFGAGIAVCSLGHAHPEVTAAIADQAGRLVHSSNYYRTAPQAELARKLVEVTGPGKVFFCNSGAEANEGLIKTARRFGSVTGRHEILTFESSFHGRTMAGISATGQEKVKIGFGPLLDGFRHLPFGDLNAVREAIGEKTVAILVEPIQGEGGIHVARREFLCGLREICDQRGLLLLFDEIQCGLGRTGAWCAWKSLAPEITPDGISWAKGIANGFPLGAFWVASTSRDDRGPLCDLLGAGSHGTTFGGNPVCCAAALKVLEIIERDGLRDSVRRMSEAFVSTLQTLNPPGIQAIRSIGLMIGVQLDRAALKRTARVPSIELVHACLEEGLLVIPAGEDVVRFLPPLNVTVEEIDLAVTKFATALKKSVKEN